MHDHVSLLAGINSRDESIREEVPAQHLGGSDYRILATPGLVWGCARSDVVRVGADGDFEVVERGGNVSLHVAVALQPEVLDELRRTFAPLGGEVEAPPDLRFAVITVPVSSGFNAIEEAATAALGPSGIGWGFGNVYDEHDAPLNWWTAD